MLGTFQKSHLRIEVEASKATIRDSLLNPAQFQQWLSPQQLSLGLPERLSVGTVFTSRLGPVAIRHHVQFADDGRLSLLLSQSIDGYHHWSWGDGWVQSCLEGVSLLPLNLGHTASLWRLRQFLTSGH